MSDALAALWRTVFGQPPPLRDDSALLTAVLVEMLPNAPPYEPRAHPGTPAQGQPTPAGTASRPLQDRVVSTKGGPPS